MTFTLTSEAAFKAWAARVACRWAALDLRRLTVGLVGELGAGKTTWVRGLLEGLGHVGRVPSPTYTLLEHYELANLTVVHLDLYRLAGPQPGGAADRGELEALGVRDWLARDGVWCLVEWPERAPQLQAQCDIVMVLDFQAGDGRRATLSAQTPTGQIALKGLETDAH